MPLTNYPGHKAAPHICAAYIVPEESYGSGHGKPKK